MDGKQTTFFCHIYFHNSMDWGVSGSIAGIFIDIGLFATPWGATNDWQALIYLVSIGGGARIGNKLGKSIFKRRYKALQFEGLTLDKKINYLMSLVNE